MTTTLLTGMPRSGTSLVCACLHTMPNCVALVEPMGGMPQARENAAAAREIVNFAHRMRLSLLADGKARSAVVRSGVPDNTYEEPRADGGLRKAHFETADIVVDKPLDDDFRLFIKHPALFTALSSELEALIPLYAIVRHPLAALASWQTVDNPIREGWWPPAEAYAPDLTARLRRLDRTLDRQAALIQWIFQVYRRLPEGHVLTYEAIVSDPVSELAKLSGTQHFIAHPVRAIDLRTRYPKADFRAFAEALMKVEEDIEPFYPDFARGLRPYLQKGWWPRFRRRIS